MERRLLLLLLCSGIVFHFTCARRYIFVTNFTDWTAARTYCRTSYADLVTVQDATVNQQLLSLAETPDCVWTGLYYSFHTWRWSMGNAELYLGEGDDDDDDDDEDAATFWGNDEPDNINGDEHCAAVSAVAAGVADTSCANSYFILCSDAANHHTLVSESMTWADAQTHCRTNFHDLATITAAHIPQILYLMNALGEGHVWIGLYRDPWSKWSDRSYTSFSNWETGPTFPTVNQCGCLTVSSGKWEESLCSQTRQFFCYTDVVTTIAPPNASSHIINSPTPTVQPVSPTTAAPSSTPLGTSVTEQQGSPTTAAPSSTPFGTSVMVQHDSAHADRKKETVLKVKLRSDSDLNNKHIQLQIVEQMQSRLTAMGVTVKWRVAKKTTPDQPPPDAECIKLVL